MASTLYVLSWSAEYKMYVALDCELTFFDLPLFLLLLHTTTAYAVRHMKPIINSTHGVTVIGITHSGVSAGIYIYIQMHVPCTYTWIAVIFNLLFSLLFTIIIDVMFDKSTGTFAIDSFEKLNNMYSIYYNVIIS